MSLTKTIKQLNLPRYLAELETINPLWVLSQKTRHANRQVSIENYSLTSQIWPKIDVAHCEKRLWQHNLVLYRPDVINTVHALLYVNGGTRNTALSGDHSQPQRLDFAKLAAETKSLVIDLQDVPNQYLSFEDEVPRMGDNLYAYSWARFLRDPERNAYWPLSLPMTKTIIKAMDAVQQIMLGEYFIAIEHFVVAGLSKRGLATWLAALHDERVAAIVPVVIDTLSTQKTMKHIYTSYNNNWPLAFHDFIREKIPESMESEGFKKLMQMEDPLAYLQQENAEFYLKRLSIPKYIISASGDDFFTPDSLNVGLPQLPGETQIRLVPNQGHYIDLQIVEDSLLAFYHNFTKRLSLPQLKWSVTQAGALSQVVVDQQPSEVKLWEAENPEKRDFRLAAEVCYQGTNVIGSYREAGYHYPVQVSFPAQGWKAHFVEMTFQGQQGSPLTLTTPAFILSAKAS